MNLLRSMEALLYEIASWAVFYPMTFWRCLRHPLRMMAYAESELSDNLDEPFVDAVSPPFFLLLTILLAHALELRLAPDNVRTMIGIFGTDQNLLVFRTLFFSMLPLLIGVERVRQKGQRLTRATLKPAFYSQCYLAGPFVLAVDLAIVVAQRTDPAAKLAASAIFATGSVWYLACLTEWFAVHRRTGRGRAFVRAVSFLALGALAVLAALFATALSLVRDAP